MKVTNFGILLLFSTLLAALNVVDAKDKTITKVVKLLQKMLDKSKKEADDDKNAYGKYKCYVDQNVAEKTASVKALGEQIELLESKISELQASNGELSGQSAALEAKMSENKAGQKAATTVREKSEKAFKEMESDLQAAIGQMQEAIDVLSAIALDQTKSAAFKTKFMAGDAKDKHKTVLLSLNNEAKNALDAVSSLLPESADREVLKSFLQSPMSAQHSKKGDAILGVLKSLMETFKGNIENARNSEKAEKKAFEDSIDVLKSSYGKMEKALKRKKQEMGDNDGELSSKKTSHEEAVKQKANDEDFLADLKEMSAKKEKEYEERKMLRANEDAAIAEAISILNSDAAFETFGDVDATSTGKTSFLQMRRGTSLLLQAEQVLEAAHSSRLLRVADRLRAGNPFKTVLAEIENMKKTIVEEGKADKEKKDWCKTERDRSGKDLDAKKSQIKTLDGAIEGLDETINDPKEGLKQQISATETSLLENQKAQVDETKTRKQENAAYQEDVMNLSDAEDILDKAIVVLKRYYDTLAKKKAFVQTPQKALLQRKKEDPSPPKTFDSYSGQSKAGGEAVGMLEFILGETKKEHSKADQDEKDSQKAFDEAMEKLKKDETDMQKGLIKIREDLAEKEKELLEKKSDLKDTTASKESIENYLTKIKPGCDFIAKNFDLREKNRATEAEALDKAAKLIKETPAYKSAAAKDKK